MAVWLPGGFRFVADAGRHIEGEAGALKRQVREGEPHLLAGDVLHLGEIGAETLDEVRLAGSGATASSFRLLQFAGAWHQAPDRFRRAR